MSDSLLLCSYYWFYLYQRTPRHFAYPLQHKNNAFLFCLQHWVIFVLYTSIVILLSVLFVDLFLCLCSSVRITWKPEYAGPHHLFSLPHRANAAAEYLGTEGPHTYFSVIRLLLRPPIAASEAYRFRVVRPWVRPSAGVSPAKSARKQNLTRNSQSKPFKVTHFGITKKPTTGCISPYNNAGLISKVSEKQSAKTLI